MGVKGGPLKKKHENMLRIFERNTLRSYGPIKTVYGDQGITVNFINFIINQIHNASDQSKTVEMVGTALQNPGTKRLQEVNSTNPEGTRRISGPAIRWLQSVEEDLKKMGFKYSEQTSQDLNQRRAIVEEAKFRPGL
jgi:hypothetical protein